MRTTLQDGGIHFRLRLEERRSRVTALPLRPGTFKAPVVITVLPVSSTVTLSARTLDLTGTRPSKQQYYLVIRWFCRLRV